MKVKLCTYVDGNGKKVYKLAYKKWLIWRFVKEYGAVYLSYDRSCALAKADAFLKEYGSEQLSLIESEII